MADDDKPGKPPVRKTRKPKGDYEVGKGKPPKHGQFKPGQSGNPAGRRRRSVRRSGHASVRVSRTMLWIVDGGVRMQVTAYEAMLLKLCSEALKGNRRAQAQILGDKLKLARMPPDDADVKPASGPLGCTVYEQGTGKLLYTNGVKPRRKPKPRKTKKRVEAEANRSIFYRVLAREVPFAEGGKTRRITIEEAIWRTMYAEALKGDVKATALIMRYADTPASPDGGALSDIISEDGVLRVTVNIGKPPGVLDG